MPIRVAIVEDIADIREGLAMLVGGSDGFTCTRTFADAESALEALPGDPPDVVLMDIHLPGMTGIECVRQLRPLCPDTQFIMSTVYEEEEQVFDALRAGANGYLLKKTPPARILEAITEVHRGESPMSGSIARKVIASFHPQPQRSPIGTSGLSEREMEILDALAKGLRYKEIADRLFISIDTVRSHIRNIYGKLQVQSRIEAVNKVFPRG